MHNIQSPRTDDESVEQEIVRKGLTAPRVTPKDVAENIASEHYFTAANGVDGHDIEVLRASEATAPLTLQPMADDPDLARTSVLGPLRLLTFCVLVLRNGFTVVGKSACASPENFDAELGRKIARQDAENQVWPLMGYELKERLYHGLRGTSPEGT